ncbi:MAG: BMC domain-containing protein [Verrucomicrobia bacterium]|nr:BMC domain-containing protein [Verrucomicrobiota bacterium]
MAARVPCLGFAECQFLSVTALVADALAKVADVRLLGLEATGSERVLIRLAGASPADVRAALDAAETTAARLGSSITTTLLAQPDDALPALNAGPLVHNPLYGGRDELRPTDHQPNLHTTMNSSPQALGILETQGLTAILEATDAMLKAANVKLVGKEKIGAAYVTVIVRGDVAAVKAAVDAGQRAAAPLGKVIAAHVIARPHDDLTALLPG